MELSEFGLSERNINPRSISRIDKLSLVAS